jgi:hypothetical protein
VSSGYGKLVRVWVRERRGPSEQLCDRFVILYAWQLVFK